MSKFLSSRLQNLEAYTPGEQPKNNEYIKLNTNENPFKQAVCEQINLASLNIYSDTNCTELTRVFAEYYNIGKNNVVFANGSDEILAFCFLAFCDDNINVCFPEISYGFYSVFAELFGIEVEKIALKEDFSIDINDYFSKKKTIIIANPNAPTSLALGIDDIEKVVLNNKDSIVIIDEAYVDFGAESSVILTSKYDNLIVCGTFSKSRSLAGARLGYAIACESLIEDINKIKYSYNPYNVNTLTQMLGANSIKNDSYFKDCIGQIINSREFFIRGLDSLGFETLNSKTNFVFTKNANIDGTILYQKLKDRKILVRHFRDELIKDYIRVSIGTMEQMQIVLDNIAQILEEKNA